ncbi:transposase family protein [Dactylosporangium sp. CA-152071]|uniref:transposase family protein n=1 Tax=Dactylosporangium sp. CA-152071 TaxID=3239933 RepID=UPI003D929630
MIHPLPSLLAVAVAAVLASARSVAAIGEWVADVPAAILAALGLVRDPFTGIHRVPDATTIGRVLASLDSDAFDTAVSRWLVGLHTPPAGQPSRRRAYAADGKTLCGSGPAGSQIHLLAAVDHHTGAVVAQTAVEGKTGVTP